MRRCRRCPGRQPPRGRSHARRGGRRRARRPGSQSRVLTPAASSPPARPGQVPAAGAGPSWGGLRGGQGGPLRTPARPPPRPGPAALDRDSVLSSDCGPGPTGGEGAGALGGGAGARHRRKATIKLFGNRLSPGSAAETGLGGLKPGRGAVSGGAGLSLGADRLDAPSPEACQGVVSSPSDCLPGCSQTRPHRKAAQKGQASVPFLRLTLSPGSPSGAAPYRAALFSWVSEHL